MKIKLADRVVQKKICQVEVRPTLWAYRCDGCGKVFEMKPFCNDQGLASLEGTFEHTTTDPETGKGLGNMFHATACSFACAHVLFTGGWRAIERYKPYADADIRLIRGALKITAYVLDEERIREAWQAVDQVAKMDAASDDAEES